MSNIRFVKVDKKTMDVFTTSTHGMPNCFVGTLALFETDEDIGIMKAGWYFDSTGHIILSSSDLRAIAKKCRELKS